VSLIDHCSWHVVLVEPHAVDLSWISLWLICGESNSCRFVVNFRFALDLPEVYGVSDVCSQTLLAVTHVEFEGHLLVEEIETAR